MSGVLLAAILGGLRWAGVNVANVVVGSSATSGFRFNTDGTVDENENGVYTQVGLWHSQKTGIGSSYQVRALSTGKVGTWDAAAAADDTWVTISAGREWSVTRGSVGVDTTSATFEIRPVSGGAAVRSATGQAQAEYSL